MFIMIDGYPSTTQGTQEGRGGGSMDIKIRQRLNHITAAC